MLVTVKVFCERNPGISRSTLYKLLSKAKENGLDGIIQRVKSTRAGWSRRILFEERDMVAWLTDSAVEAEEEEVAVEQLQPLTESERNWLDRYEPKEEER